MQNLFFNMNVPQGLVFKLHSQYHNGPDCSLNACERKLLLSEGVAKKSSTEILANEISLLNKAFAEVMLEAMPMGEFLHFQFLRII